MKQFHSQLKKKAASLKLSAIERADLRERLHTYIEYHPMPDSVPAAQSTEVASESAATPTRAWGISILRFGSLVSVLMLTVLGSVSYVAEQAVPGDALYPIKVQFNEELRGGLALSPYEKVEWESERLSRRIAEARLLESEGKLTPAFEEKVAQAVRTHSDAARAGIAALRESDAEEAAIAEIVFASALDVQSTMLTADELARGTTSSSTDDIASAIAEQWRLAIESQTKSDGVPSLSRLRAHIELETTRAQELLASIKPYATEQEIADIERHLENINRKVAAASTTTDATNEAEEPRTLLREALQRTSKLIAFMTDIDVRETVTLSELLPAEYTSEEYEALIDSTVAEVETARTSITAAVSTSTDSEIASQVEIGLEELDELLERAQTQQESSDYLPAFTAANDARMIANDLRNLLGITPDGTSTSTASTTATSTTSTSTSTATTTDAGAGTTTESTSTDATVPTSTPAAVGTNTPPAEREE